MKPQTSMVLAATKCQRLAVQRSQLWSLFLKLCFRGMGRGAGGMVKPHSWKGTHKRGAGRGGKGCIPVWP